LREKEKEHLAEELKREATNGNPMGLEVSGISGVEICYIFLMVYWVIALGFPIKRCDMMLYAVFVESQI